LDHFKDDFTDTATEERDFTIDIRSVCPRSSQLPAAQTCI
jgi:hypothetical protein